MHFYKQSSYQHSICGHPSFLVNTRKIPPAFSLYIFLVIFYPPFSYKICFTFYCVHIPYNSAVYYYTDHQSMQLIIIHIRVF